MGVTVRDRFWARVQLDLMDLPRTWAVMEKLEAVDPELHYSLAKGERWLLHPIRSVTELDQGWAWWFRLFCKAVDLLASDIMPTEKVPPLGILRSSHHVQLRHRPPK